MLNTRQVCLMRGRIVRTLKLQVRDLVLRQLDVQQMERSGLQLELDRVSDTGVITEQLGHQHLDESAMADQDQVR